MSQWYMNQVTFIWQISEGKEKKHQMTSHFPERLSYFNSYYFHSVLISPEMLCWILFLNKSFKN